MYPFEMIIFKQFYEKFTLSVMKRGKNHKIFSFLKSVFYMVFAITLQLTLPNLTPNQL
jgi:hypothetical protein